MQHRQDILKKNLVTTKVTFPLKYIPSERRDQSSIKVDDPLKTTFSSLNDGSAPALTRLRCKIASLIFMTAILVVRSCHLRTAQQRPIDWPPYFCFCNVFDSFFLLINCNKLLWRLIPIKVWGQVCKGDFESEYFYLRVT